MLNNSANTPPNTIILFVLFMFLPSIIKPQLLRDLTFGCFSLPSGQFRRTDSITIEAVIFSRNSSITDPRQPSDHFAFFLARLKRLPGLRLGLSVTPLFVSQKPTSLEIPLPLASLPPLLVSTSYAVAMSTATGHTRTDREFTENPMCQCSRHWLRAKNNKRERVLRVKSTHLRARFRMLLLLLFQRYQLTPFSTVRTVNASTISRTNFPSAPRVPMRPKG